MVRSCPLAAVGAVMFGFSEGVGHAKVDGLAHLVDFLDEGMGLVWWEKTADGGLRAAE